MTTDVIHESITWVPVEDHLPDADVMVLAYSPDASSPVWPAYIDEDGWTWAEGHLALDRITHWAHLPGGPAPV